MKKQILIAFVVIVPIVGAVAQPQNVVKEFGNLMQQWCSTDDISFHPRIMKIAPHNSGIKCLVDDKITRDAVENDQSGWMSKGTQEIDTYMNIFQSAISDGQKYAMSNIVEQTDFVEPTAIKDVTPPSFVSASLKLSGSLNYDITDLFYVRDGKITKIVDFSSDNSLGHAIQLYSHRKYDEAFRLFRKMAYERFTNFDAQYYMVVMEIKGQGCNHLSKKVKDTEIAWFLTKNINGGREDATKLAISFVLDESKLPYAYFNKNWYDHAIHLCQPAANGRMVVFDKKSKTCGVINEQGQQVVPFKKYSAIYPYHDGMALVCSETTKRWGYIDENGKETIPLIYESANIEFHRGRTFCYKDKQVYLVEKDGKVLKIIENHFLNPLIPSCSKYVALARADGKQYDFYDYEGNIQKEGINKVSIDRTRGIIKAYEDNVITFTYMIEW